MERLGCRRRSARDTARTTPTHSIQTAIPSSYGMSNVCPGPWARPVRPEHVVRLCADVGMLLCGHAHHHVTCSWRCRRGWRAIVQGPRRGASMRSE